MHVERLFGQRVAGQGDPVAPANAPVLHQRACAWPTRARNTVSVMVTNTLAPSGGGSSA